jgi:hypothetical protein
MIEKLSRLWFLTIMLLGDGIKGSQNKCLSTERQKWNETKQMVI